MAKIAYMFTVVYDVNILQFIMTFIFNLTEEILAIFNKIQELSRFTETSVLHTSIVLISYCRLTHTAQ
jgi:hypothetical protein